jgi:hypothetical protein
MKSPIQKLPVLALAAVLGAACPGGGGGSFESRFVDACSNSVNWSQAMCACMAKKAEKELSGAGREFLLASLAGDEAKTEALRGRLSVQEALEVGTFMLKGGACVGG